MTTGLPLSLPEANTLQSGLSLIAQLVLFDNRFQRVSIEQSDIFFQKINLFHTQQMSKRMEN